MYFLWPQYLWLAVALALLPLAYVWLLRRRNQAAVRYSSLGVVRAAAAAMCATCPSWGGSNASEPS